MSRSIFWKITLPLILIILIGMGALGIFTVNSVRTNQIAQLTSHLAKEARLVAEEALPDYTGPSQSLHLSETARTTGKLIGARVTIIALDGTVLGDSSETPATLENQSKRPEFIQALSSGMGESTLFSAAVGENIMYVAVPASEQGDVRGIVRVALPLTDVESAVNGTLATIIWAMSVVALFVILTAVLIARMITHPVREVTRAVDRIAAGQLEQTIPLTTNDEIGQLGYAFNKMSVSLKQMLDTVSDERTKLATILAAITDGVVMTDAKGSIILTNPAAEQLFNFKFFRAEGSSLIESIHDHEISAVLTACLKTSKKQVIQVDTVSGQFIRVVAVPLINAKQSGALLLFQDLTEMRSLQTMRREFVGNISHELRTPLAGMRIIVETLQDGAIDDRETATKFLNKLEVEIDHMTHMVTELIDLSRIETGRAYLKLESVNLNVLIEKALERLAPQAEKKQVAVSTDLFNKLPPAQVDAERITQVIINLVHNGIKFTPAGGKVTVATRLEAGSIVVSVVDNGIGISKADLPHIFERFFKADRSRSGKGSGLGLAIAKHTIQAHRGTIQVESEEGKGATFSFRLPVLSATPGSG